MKGRLEMPKFLRDIYGDLRDRHLLVPFVGLIVAIAAVPFLLGGDPAPVPSAPATADVPPGAAELQPAVLAEQTGIRNYRKRLEALQKKNPFKQQFLIEAEDTSVSVGTGAEVADPSISLAGEDPGTSEPVTSPSGAETSTSPSPGGDPSVSVDGDPDSPPASDEDTTEVREVETVISYRVGVEVGRAGKLQSLDAVDKFQPLPSKQDPVVIYVGVSEDAKRAAFLVSRDVIETKGEGICTRSQSGSCALLTMRVGEEREFFHGPDAGRFRLKLRSISAVENSAGE